MKSILRRGAIVGFVAVIALGVNTNEARASVPPTFDGLVGDTLIVAGVALATILTSVPPIVNAFSIDKKRQGSLSNISLGVVAAAVDVTIATQLLSMEGDRGARFRPVGLFFVGLATVNVGLSVWSAVLPKQTIDPPVIPTVIADIRGNVVPALTTKVFRF